MSNELQPIINQWYRHTDKGQSFYVNGLDANTGTIEVQHFDGDIEEFTWPEWHALDIERCGAPGSWDGPLDVGNKEDYGTDITDTTARAWTGREDLYPEEQRAAEDTDDYDEGHMEEEPLGPETQQQAAEPGERLLQRPDGIYEETFDDNWNARYSENPEDGLWRADLFNGDTATWRQEDFMSLQDARAAARNNYEQV